MAQIPCPKCNSYKVSSDRSKLAGLGAMLTFLGLVFSPFVFPVFIAIAGVSMILMAVFKKHRNMECRACSYRWKV